MNETDRRTRSLHLLLMLTVLALVCTSSGLAQTADMTVRVMDVGHGDAILVQFPNGQNMLVDAGDSGSGSRVVDYLKNDLKIKKIDILVATHPHEDHVGGMPAVVKAFEIGNVWDSGYDCNEHQQFLRALRKNSRVSETRKSGYTKQVGEARIDVLAPVKPISGTDNDPNNNCLVLRIVYNNVSFLLAGDMETDERATVHSFPRSTVLKVAHHGSSDGTDSRFLAEVSPEYAVISLAAKNDFGYPHASVLDALKKLPATVYCTSTCGTVVFTTDGNAIKDVKPQRSAECVIPAATPLPQSPPAVAPPPPPPAAATRYIGNVNSLAFHLPTCNSLPAKKNQVWLKSREEAIALGYHPCGRCKP